MDIGGATELKTLEERRKSEKERKRAKERKQYVSGQMSNRRVKENIALMITMGLSGTRQHNVKTIMWKLKWKNKVYMSMVLIEKYLLKIYGEKRKKKIFTRQPTRKNNSIPIRKQCL